MRAIRLKKLVVDLSFDNAMLEGAVHLGHNDSIRAVVAWKVRA